MWSRVCSSGVRFSVEGSGFGVWGLEFRLGISILRSRVRGSGYRAQGLGFSAEEYEFRVQGSGSRVKDSGFSVRGSES